MSMDILKGGEGECGGLGVQRYPVHLQYCDRLRNYLTYSDTLTSVIAMEESLRLAREIAKMKAKQAAMA